jgi:hypothetical protein
VTRSGRYARLAPGSSGADICPVHLLLNRARVEAVLDATEMRESADPGTQQWMARAERCAESPGDVWHVFMPRKGQMQGIRRKLRAQGVLPPLS